jgi:CRP/FNR family cyclic AMP-dependent transcriptional regulator
MWVADIRSSVAFWRSFPIFETFTEPAIAELNRVSQTRHWSAGETIFQRGDDGDHVVAIADGRIKLSLITQAGRELTLRQAGPGEILGEFSLLDGAPRSADAMAVIATRARVISKADFTRLLDDFAELRPLLIVYLCRRLRDTTDQLESIALFELEARLARYLLLALRQVFEDDLPAEARLRLDLSQGEIANMLGASRPKVNRAIQNLQMRGAISRDGAVLTCFPEILRQCSETAL